MIKRYDRSCETRFELASGPNDRGVVLPKVEGHTIQACTHITLSVVTSIVGGDHD